jgi:hypothetical protein
MLTFQPFLTAYDPSDLPGASVDPLGFDRGYALLADKILPGLTNVANRPRYFSAFCAAVHVSDGRSGDIDETPQDRRARRLAAAQRLERFWALGCVLASNEIDDLPSEGLRGIRDVTRAMQRLKDKGERETSGDFRLLSRQVTYGMVGIYGSVADALKLLERDGLTLGTDLGERLGTAFVRDTEMPAALRRAVAEEGSVSLKTLEAWATRAHLAATPGADEACILFDAFQAADVRSRMGALLVEHPPREEEAELARLERIERALAGVDRDPDLREALRAIVAFERCYRSALLAFQRILWFCQAENPFRYDLASAERDVALSDALAEIRAASQHLEAAVEEGETPRFTEHLDRLRDARAFLRDAASAPTPGVFVERVLKRHSDVQRTKLDRGRSKLPWLELRDGVVTPTLAIAQQLNRAPETVDELPTHPYRTVAADRFCAMGAVS